MKYDYFSDFKPFYEANVWFHNGGDPLLLEGFTTKREAIKCIKDFIKSYNGNKQLDCFVNHFDETQCVDYSFDVGD